MLEAVQYADRAGSNASEYDEYLFIFVRQGEVGLDVCLHSSEQVRIYGVPQYTCTLKRCLDLKIHNS